MRLDLKLGLQILHTIDSETFVTVTGKVLEMFHSYIGRFIVHYSTIGFNSQ